MASTGNTKVNASKTMDKIATGIGRRAYRRKVWQHLQGTALARVSIPKLKSPLKTLSNSQRCASPG